jgi:cob(I)alamin adenosyltransferase
MKTESAIGCTVRALENGDNVLFVQFLKDGKSSELTFFKDKMFTNIDVLTGDIEKITLPSNITTVDKFKAQVLFTDMCKGIECKQYQLLVADELLPAIDMGLITIEQFEYLVNKCNAEDIDLYTTGRVRQRSLRLKIAELSDICTDAHCVKHSYNAHCSKCNKDYKHHYTYCPDCSALLEKSRPVKKGRDY